MSILAIKQVPPEFQARQDWRDEGVFRPRQYQGLERRRYVREAVRIELEHGNEAALAFIATRRNGGSGSACHLAH
jgi:hypothetical protein